MEPFRYHVFVCDQKKPEGVPCCSARGSAAVLESLRKEIALQGLTDAVQVTVCGSLGLCDHGPNMVVYPEGIWYSRVTPDDVAEIVRSHLAEGNPVERLARIDTQELRAEILSNREKMQAAMRARDAAGALPDDFMEAVRSFQDSRVILSAVELDLFGAVGQGADAATVARAVGTDPRATEMLLNALCSLRVLKKIDGLFYNTAASSRYLGPSSPDCAHDYLMHTVDLWARWSSLTECVRAGTAVARNEAEERSGDWTRHFIGAMNRIARERVPLVVRAVGADRKKRMLDVGGGSAAYSIGFCRANPSLEAEVFDLPEVIGLTRQYIEKAGLAARIKTRAGDLENDTLGSGFDLVLVSQICHSLGEAENRSLVRKCRDALVQDGVLIIQEFIVDEDGTSPKHAALFALNMLVGTPAGRTYTEKEISGWMREAGFQDVRRIRLPGPSGLILGTR